MIKGQTHLARHAERRTLLLAAVTLCGLAVAAAVVRWEGLLAPPTPPKVALVARPTPPFVRPLLPVPTVPELPSFDVVRVDRAGHAVMAGRAPAGSQVTVAVGGPTGNKVIGQATSDEEGQWILVPSQPLPGGAGALTLSARLANGKSLTSLDRVVVVVPHHPGEAPPVALLSGAAEAPRLIEAPPAAGAASPVVLDLLQYGQHASLLLVGRAPPDADVRIYIDNHPVGDAHADTSGHWSMSLARAVLPGSHQIRLDQLSPTGAVVARTAVPFDRPAEPLSAAGRAIVVRPGECLWVIAEHVYGTGVRYTLVFQANHDQIRNPNLIYPGQVLTLPSPPSAAEHHG